MVDPILTVDRLVCGYESFLLRDVNIDVRPGEMIGIIGPNGSGKTTLLRALGGILKPREGAVSLNGEDIRHIDLKAFARNVAMVFQETAAPGMTVEEYVTLGRIPHYEKFQFLETREDFDQVERALTLTETLELRHKQMGEMSGGQRQLVLLARAIAQQPQLLLLDEPTTFLDITHQVRVLGQIRRLNRDSGVTVVMVLHDLNLAAEYCDRLILVNDGHIHSDGPPCEVLTYQIIEEVYDTIVVVGQSPVSQKPYIFVVT